MPFTASVPVPTASTASTPESMPKPFKSLVARMSPGAQERVKARTREMLLEKNLQELRLQHAELTQVDAANFCST